MSTITTSHLAAPIASNIQSITKPSSRRRSSRKRSPGRTPSMPNAVLEPERRDGVEVARAFCTQRLGGHPKPATDGHLKTGHHA